MFDINYFIIHNYYLLCVFDSIHLSGYNTVYYIHVIVGGK